ncbi:MAG TPA: peptidylprolyl isomerase [Chryseosolibacter sp.]
MTLFKRSAAIALLSSLIVFLVQAQANHNGSSSALFFIGKKPVSTEEFLYLYRKNHRHTPDEYTGEKMEEYLNLFINYKLKVEEALSRGMDTTAAFKKEYQTYRKELLKPYLPDSRVVDSLVVVTYNRLKEEVNASHLLVALKPDAPPADTLEAYKKISDLRRRALAGEDFGDLAARYSDEPGAKTTRGNLGYFTAMQMVFPFEQAAYGTPVGGISEPVRTQYGYHIIKVLDRQPARGEVEVSHIMIRTGGGAADEKAKNAIFDVYDKLQKGMDWEEACSQYSEDLSTKDKGGRLRPFGVGAMNSVPEFQDMAFSLREKGEISDPFQTRYGWHIIRLESKIPLPPLEEMKGSLTQRVSRDERVTISRQAVRERMKKEFGYSEDAAIRSKVMALADSSLTKGKWNPEIDRSLEHATLFTMGNKPATVKAFLDYASSHNGPVSLSPGEYLEQLFNQYIDEAQAQLLEDRVMLESPDYKWLLREYYEGILLFAIMEKEVWNRAMEDTVGQRNYFSAHAGRYQAGERIAGRIYTSPSREDLEALKNLLLAGDTSARNYITRHGIKVQTGPFEKGDRSILSNVEWSPGAYLTENGGASYLVEVETILPPGPKTFGEARASVISDYQTFLEEAWIKELKAKFGVKVKKKAKKEVFGELARSKDHNNL